jgi:HEAT repeat protein
VISNLQEFGEQLTWYFPDDVERLLTQALLPELYNCRRFSDSVFSVLSETLAVLFSFLQPSRFIESEWPRLKNLLHADQKVIRGLVGDVFEYLPEYLDMEVHYPQFFDLICTLTGDPSGLVRSRVPGLIVLYLPKVTGARSRADLSTHFQVFAGDPSRPVRTAVANKLTAFSSALTDAARSIFTLPVLTLLLEDDNDEVRGTILGNLGRLVMSIGPTVHSSIIEKYCQTLVSSDGDLSYAAAFTFPGVALMLGEERWEELQSDFVTATLSTEEPVRRTLAAGLTCYAHLVPTFILTPIVIAFLKDIPDVARGIIGGLYEIRRFLDPAADVIFCLQEPLVKYVNWRIRLQVSHQLRMCADDWDAAVLFQAASELTRDTVAIVRNDAAISFAVLLEPDRISVLEEMAGDQSFFFREAAAIVCQNLTRRKAEMGIGILIKLSQDPVPNVRITAGRAVAHLSTMLKGSAELAAIVTALSIDPDPDVRFAASLTD